MGFPDQGKRTVGILLLKVFLFLLTSARDFWDLFYTLWGKVDEYKQWTSGDNSTKILFGNKKDHVRSGPLWSLAYGHLL